MTKENIYFAELGATAELATFVSEGGVTEQHALLHVEARGEMFAAQLDRICRAEAALLALSQCAGGCTVFKRYFLSDATNQQKMIEEKGEALACGEGCSSVSCIGQAPLDGSKIAAWLYIVHGMEVTTDGEGMVTASHNGYRHLWRMGVCCPEGDSAQQTETLLSDYEAALERHGATLADNCIRTWFYVRDVDTQYAGLVRARRDNFTRQGLTSQTHYIASTGIGGLPADTRAIVQLGTYALVGFKPSQQRYLYARTHLNPTYEYGVTFERGTVMEYGDRSHIYISGTASIDNKGEVVHVGDIVQQTFRMWENVGALLAEAEAGFEDVAQIIVYLRDICDYDTVRALFAERFPSVPCVITHAPVCRPAWLIEMECVAIRPACNPGFRDF